MDRERLCKVLNLMRSDNDHEALLASRRATALVESAGMTWELLLLVGPTKAEPRVRQPTPEDTRIIRQFGRWYGEGIETFLEEVFDACSASQEPFVASLQEWFETKRFLTDKQYEALRNVGAEHGVYP